jgi:murein DD-endopeptidase MepM/ murein hydrolase activator NlpD
VTGVQTCALPISADDTQNIQNAILDGIDGVEKMYVLEVNGAPVGAAGDIAVLDGVLNGILDDYSTDLTLSVNFADTVMITRRYINTDIAQDPAEIRRLLEPADASSPHSLTVRSTEQAQYTKTIGYSVAYYDDAALYEGSTAVVTEGVDGEKLITENTVYVNGVKQSSQVVGDVTTKEPVTELIAGGTAPRPKTASFGFYIWPAEGVLTSGFGPRTGFGSSNHQGIDIAGFYGDDIVAADGGEVILADWYYGYGLLVQIRHDNGDVTYYGHCCELLVAEGERVYQGQVIAHMGETGVASGVHCHFEIRKDGTRSTRSIGCPECFDNKTIINAGRSASRALFFCGVWRGVT